MDIVIVIGRILFGAVFLTGAVGHLTRSADMAGYAEAKGVKPGRPAVLASGAWMLLGALSVVLGVWADLGALMLAVFLLPTAVLMHPFWKETDAEQRSGEKIHFHKDISLAGAALVMFGLFAGHHVGLMFTRPLF